MRAVHKRRRTGKRKVEPVAPEEIARRVARRLGLPADGVVRLVGSEESARKWSHLGRQKKKARIRYLLEQTRAGTDRSEWAGFEETGFAPPEPRPDTTRYDREIAEAQEETAAAREETEDLRGRLAHRTDMRVESPAIADNVGGRTALTKLGKNVAWFMEEVSELPVVAATQPPGSGEYMAHRAAAVFEVIMGPEPRTAQEGKRRALVEHFLTHRPLRRLLTEPTAAGEVARDLFRSLFLRSGVDTVSGELLRRSGEMGAARSSAPIDDSD